MRKLTPLIGREKIMLIITNQLRQKMNAMPFEDQYVTPGGKAPGFHSSVRLRLKHKADIKNKDKEVIGSTVSIKVVKNRFGPPKRTVELDIYFDRGIDNETSMFKFLKAKEVFRTNGAWTTYVDQHGEEHKFTAGSFKDLLVKNPDLKTELAEKIAQVTVTSYSSEGVNTEDGSTIQESDYEGED
jgi:recombination protein RecA